MTSPLIGITTYGRDEKGRFSLPSPYVDCVRRAGGIPVLLPPGEPRQMELASCLHGMILAGGGDVDPGLCGSQPHRANYMVDPERDSSEIALVRSAVREQQPTLGICRGAQVINVALGGSLIEHLPEVVGETVPHRLAPQEPSRHPIRLEPNCLMGTILARTDITAASMHHQAIRRLARSLMPVAWAPDGVIEAVELVGHPWMIGVQWHPEMTAAEDPTQQRLFDALVKAAADFARPEKRTCA